MMALVDSADLEKIVRAITSRLRVLETQEHSHKPAGYTTVVFSNGWTDYGPPFAPCRWTKDASGIVVVEGLTYKSPAVHVNGDLIATLPVGARPALQLIFNARVAGGTTRLDVGTGGQILLYDDGAVASPEVWLSLASIRFRAA